MQHGITPEDQLRQSYLIHYTGSQAPVSGPTSIQELFEMRNLKQFHKIFLQNQLCRNIQNAIRELKMAETQNVSTSLIPDSSSLSMPFAAELKTVLDHCMHPPCEDQQQENIFPTACKPEKS